jgi:hypothetical protein
MAAAAGLRQVSMFTPPASPFFPFYFIFIFMSFCIGYIYIHTLFQLTQLSKRKKRNHADP